MRRDKNKDKDSPGHPGAQSALHTGNHGASWLPCQPSGLLEGSWTPLSLTFGH